MPPLQYKRNYGSKSGLICLNWYDWNLVFSCFVALTGSTGRDWSAWIDTIETQKKSTIFQVLYKKSGLICLNWYDWNSCAASSPSALNLRRDWSAWIDTIETMQYGHVIQVHLRCRDWSAWIDTIETMTLLVNPAFVGFVGIDLPELIRLKPFSFWTLSSNHDRSGLICLNWYDWNFSLGTSGK